MYVPSPTAFLTSQQLVVHSGREILGQCLLGMDEKGVVESRGRGVGGRDGWGRGACGEGSVRLRHGERIGIGIDQGSIG